MLQFFISFLLVFTWVESKPLVDVKGSQVLKYENNNDGTGKYSFFYETSNNIYREETGELTKSESENPIFVVRGFYSYTDDDGEQYEVHYVADEKGFRQEVKKSTNDPNELKPFKVSTEFPSTTPSTTTEETIIPEIGSAAIGSLSGGGLGK